MLKTHAYAAVDPKSPLGPFNFERREPGARDVQIEILYCGVCHSDIHQVRDEWGGSIYPMVPGHEIVGRVSAVGGAGEKFKGGGPAAGGGVVGSDRGGENCVAGGEQECMESAGGADHKIEKSGETAYGGGGG